MAVSTKSPIHQEPSNLHSLTKFFTLESHTAWSGQKIPGDATTSMGRIHQGLAGCCMANLLGTPTRDKCTVTTVMLLWLYTPMHQELTNLHSLTKFFTLGFPTTCRSQKVTGHATA